MLLCAWSVPVSRGSHFLVSRSLRGGVFSRKKPVPLGWPSCPCRPPACTRRPRMPSRVLRARAARPVCGTPRRGAGGRGGCAWKAPKQLFLPGVLAPQVRGLWERVRDRRAPAVPRWGFGAPVAGPDPSLISGVEPSAPDLGSWRVSASVPSALLLGDCPERRACRVLSSRVRTVTEGPRACTWVSCGISHPEPAGAAA